MALLCDLDKCHHFSRFQLPRWENGADNSAHLTGCCEEKDRAEAQANAQPVGRGPRMAAAGTALPLEAAMAAAERMDSGAWLSRFKSQLHPCTGCKTLHVLLLQNSI